MQMAFGFAGGKYGTLHLYPFILRYIHHHISVWNDTPSLILPDFPTGGKSVIICDHRTKEFSSRRPVVAEAYQGKQRPLLLLRGHDGHHSGGLCHLDPQGAERGESFKVCR